MYTEPSCSVSVRCSCSCTDDILFNETKEKKMFFLFSKKNHLSSVEKFPEQVSMF